MPIHEELSEQFYAWEKRGRGWIVRDHPVYPEPPFIPFNGYEARAEVEDDGRRPTFLSSLVRGLSESLATPKPAAPPPILASEPEPEIFERTGIVELQLALPKNFAGKLSDMAPMLRQLGLCNEPIAFELLGTEERIVVQFAAAESDTSTLRRQLKALFPEIVITETEGVLSSAWGELEEAEHLVVEFGLAREFALPLADLNSDPFIGLVAAMEDLAPGEVAIFQVLFQAAVSPWANHLLRAVTDAAGKPFFCNAPEITQLAQEKTSSPLFAAVVRMAIKADDFDHILGIAREMAGAFRLYARLDGNELIPLENTEYPYEAHCEDVILRQSRRSGMLLNTDELLGFVHLPTANVRSSKLQRDAQKTKAAPPTGANGLLLGHNTHAGKTVEVRLDAAARSRHAHIIGASGSGKSTLLLNLIRQDLESGEGIAVLDPHGDLVDAVLGMIPEHRIEDVVFLNPSDETHAIGFNILSAHSELEKTLLASDLVSVFRRLSTSWGDQMNSVLQNAITAFLENSQGGTLMELRRFLIEPGFRKRFLETVADSEVLYYWTHGFPQLSGNKSVGPIVTRLDAFLAHKVIRHMVAQRENRLDFANIMDARKIFLAKLSTGAITPENTFLLGSFLVGKFQQTAMSRQSQATSSRQPFTLVVDEFQNFITPSMAEILTGTRKYGLSLILAHQELRQLEREREVASAVFGAHTRICFRLVDEDARKLADGFSSFDARDLLNLSVGQAICRLERSDADFNLSVPKLDMPETGARELVITRSREKYSRLRSEVEAELCERLKMAAEPEKKSKPKFEPPPEPPPTALPSKPPAPPAPAPPLAEAPKPQPTGMLPAPPAPIAEVPQPALPPKDLGRGGAQHKAIQQRLKAEAEKFGFRSTIEKSVLDGQGSIDLLVERDGTSIAVEITISTTVDHEVGNIVKCLKAGCQRVAVVSIDEDRLRELEKAVSASLGAEVAGRISYYKPDQFVAHIKTLPGSTPKDAVSVHHGYKVKRSTPKLTAEEHQQREALAHQVIADAVQTKKRQGK